jgi:dihydrolipoamide dehydrogenase
LKPTRAVGFSLALEETMSKQFDVVVIGAGPGGYIAAIRAASWASTWPASTSGRTRRAARAGRHLHQRGLHSVQGAAAVREHFEHAGKHFAEHGISLKDLKMDVAKMIGRKDAVVKQNNDGILYLFKKNKVTFFHGRGSFVRAVEGGYEIKVAGKAEEV